MGITYSVFTQLSHHVCTPSPTKIISLGCAQLTIQCQTLQLQTEATPVTAYCIRFSCHTLHSPIITPSDIHLVAHPLSPTLTITECHTPRSHIQ